MVVNNEYFRRAGGILKRMDARQFALRLTKCRYVSDKVPRGDLMSDKNPLGGHL